MIIDTSVLLAILLREPARDRLLMRLAEVDQRLVSVFSLYEAATVLLNRRGNAALPPLLALVQEAALLLVAFDEHQAMIAMEVYQKQGKGIHRHHLNLGDCVVCALAIHRQMPIFSTSQEFTRAGFAGVHP